MTLQMSDNRFVLRSYILRSKMWYCWFIFFAADNRLLEQSKPYPFFFLVENNSHLDANMDYDGGINYQRHIVDVPSEA